MTIVHDPAHARRGLRFPAEPSADEIRQAELALLPGLIAETRQPPVGRWKGRCSGLVRLIIATEDAREVAA